MAQSGAYVFIVSMDVDADKEDLFNEVYDEEHIPYLLEVSGVLSVKRYTLEPLEVVIGGERKSVAVEGEPKYSAVYEIDSPDVLVSEAWSNAVERGRWAEQVRPYTHNRRHVLRKLIT